MSEQQQEGYYTYNNNKFYKDKYGSWFVKDSGYESLFVSGIKDEELKEAVIYELNTNPDAKINFKFQDKWYTIWNNEDSTKIKLDRKAEHGEAALQNTTYDRTEQTKGEVKLGASASAPKNYNSNSFGSSSSGNKKSYFVDEMKLAEMTVEEFKKGIKFEFMWSLADKASENVKLVQMPDGTVKYHIILQHKKEFGGSN